MYKKVVYLFFFVISMSWIISCQTQADSTSSSERSEMIQETLNNFSETEITYDHSLLNDNQWKVIEHLYNAAVITDSLFLRQVYKFNPEIKAELMEKKDPEDQMSLELFNIMFGPFNRLEDDEPFYGEREKPDGANYYPLDMTKSEFNQWIEAHPEDEKAFTSEFTMIRREDEGLIAIPYSEYFRQELAAAAGELRSAAEYAENPTLKTYLKTRAEAFLTDDYYESDMAWMDLEDHLIEVVIGPYEVYEDKLFNYKAAFETFITIRDPEESKKVERFAGYLTEMERHLPIPDKYKNFDRGLDSPIVIAQELFSAGDTKAGVQTLAFNLPNDERVRKAKGSKKVMLKNVNQAKFEKILLPIAGEVLAQDQIQHVTFDAFFNHVLMHEMSHGIGPGYITINGEEMEVRDALKETYSTIEECKADILGMYNNVFMIQKGEFSAEFEEQVWATFLAGTFRSVRFGIEEAHGAGNAIIYNYLLENGAYEYDADENKVRVDEETIGDVLEDLARKVLLIQAEGNYQGALDLIQKYAVKTESMKALIVRLNDIPVDIKPIFQLQKELSGTISE